jgi:hypothetical protein
MGRPIEKSAHFAPMTLLERASTTTAGERLVVNGVARGLVGPGRMRTAKPLKKRTVRIEA